MKKLILLLIAALVIITSTEMKAQCDEGFTLTTKQVFYNGCWYNVDICYKCIGTNPNSVVKIVGLREVNPPCPSLLTFEQIINAIYNIIYTPEYIIHNLCTNTLPPCDVEPYGIKYWYIRPVCWQKVKTGPDQIEYYVCQGSSNCVSQWRVCWLNGIAYQFCEVGPVLDTPSSCPTTPEPEDPIGIGQWSTCFTVTTLCN